MSNDNDSSEQAQGQKTTSGGDQFLNKINKAVYIDSGMSLDDRINRTAHHRARDIAKDD